MTMSMKYKIIMAAGLVAAFFCALNYFGDKPQPVTVIPQIKAETPQGIAKTADAAKVPISGGQAVKVSEKILKRQQPDKVVPAAVQDVKKAVSEIVKETGSDFAIVTDPKKPDEKPVIKEDESVQLNVYNIKAYPKHMVEVGIGIHGADLAYLRRVDVPRVPLLLPKGAIGYMGPFIRTEYESGKVDGGLRLVAPF